jgi:hypothetical protein
MDIVVLRIKNYHIPYIGKKMPFATGVDIETGEFTL